MFDFGCGCLGEYAPIGAPKMAVAEASKVERLTTKFKIYVGNFDVYNDAFKSNTWKVNSTFGFINVTVPETL